MPFALLGIDDGGLNLAVNLLVLFLVVVWLALVAWTYLDAKRRIEDQVLVMCATVAALFPFVGAIVYAILRPPEYLEDARERELEIHSAELRLHQLMEKSCPNCEQPVDRSYLRCPRCRVRLKEPCPSCEKPLDPRWKLCPYCELPVRRPERKRRPPERRGRAEGERRAEAPRTKRRTSKPEEGEETAPSRRSGSTRPSS